MVLFYLPPSLPPFLSLSLSLSLCSNYYNKKRLGQYGPVSAHMNEERVNFAEGIIIIALLSNYGTTIDY